MTLRQQLAPSAPAAPPSQVAAAAAATIMPGLELLDVNQKLRLAGTTLFREEEFCSCHTLATLLQLQTFIDLTNSNMGGSTRGPCYILCIGIGSPVNCFRTKSGIMMFSVKDTLAAAVGVDGNSKVSSNWLAGSVWGLGHPLGYMVPRVRVNQGDNVPQQVATPQTLVDIMKAWLRAKHNGNTVETLLKRLEFVIADLTLRMQKVSDTPTHNQPLQSITHHAFHLPVHRQTQLSMI